MKNNVLTVMKKECSRIFNDRKLFFTTVILPGLLMFGMYTLMGTFFDDMLMVEEDYVYQVHAVNLPDSVAELLAPQERIELHHIGEYDIDDIKSQIENRLTDLLVVFPEDFDVIVADFDPEAAAVEGVLAPNVQVWSNFARNESHEANSLVSGILHEYHHSLTHRFTINAPTEYAYDFNLATDADMFAMILGMVIPLLFILFIFTGCQSLAPESIAGEKERGSLGSVLVTPANRSHIALGKILGISVFSLLSAVGSILGAVLAMPTMMGLDDSIFEFYSVVDFLLLFLVAASTTLVFVAVLSVLSAYAKSVKEATAYSMPIMLLVFVAGFAGMIVGEVPDSIIFYFIPVINSSLCIGAIFAFEANVANILITSGINFGVALALTVGLAQIFNSEKIVFS